MMEYLTGKTEKDTREISEILAEEQDGQEICIHGAIHKIRDMGEVAFIILRKREGSCRLFTRKG